MSAPVTLQLIVGFLMFSVVFVPLERYFPLRQKRAFRCGWATDVTYYAVGCFVANLSDATSRLGAMLLIRNGAGLNTASMAANQAGWVQFLEILILTDFLAYLFHRALHQNAYLWRLHRVHHTSTNMDWLANVRLHPIDKILGDCFQFIPIFWLGFGDTPLLAYTIFLGFQGFLNHSNIRIDFGPLRWIIASPQFHHWHHDNDARSYNKNFAPHLVIFDVLFRTVYFPPGYSMPAKYGIPDPVPRGFWGQIIYPFRPIKLAVETAGLLDHTAAERGGPEATEHLS